MYILMINEWNLDLQACQILARWTSHEHFLMRACLYEEKQLNRRARSWHAGEYQVLFIWDFYLTFQLWGWGAMWCSIASVKCGRGFNLVLAGLSKWRRKDLREGFWWFKWWECSVLCWLWLQAYMEQLWLNGSPTLFAHECHLSARRKAELFPAEIEIQRVGKIEKKETCILVGVWSYGFMMAKLVEW